MKKSILLSAAILLTISAFALAKWNSTIPDEKKKTTKVKASHPEQPLPLFMPKPANLYYDLGSRFKPMKKSAIQASLTVKDFLNLDYNWPIKTIEDVNIILIEDNKHSNIQFASQGENLTKEQIKFLNTCEYSTNLKVQSKCMVTDRNGQNSQWLKCIEHISIVPEQQARYSTGKHAFLKYLKEENKKNTFNLDMDILSFAKLTFTVKKDGSISELNLDKSSGYEKIDNAVKDLLKNAPDKWLPAVNAEGLNVEQELVISFGLGGC